MSRSLIRYLDTILADRSSPARLSYDAPSRAVIRGQLLELVEHSPSLTIKDVEFYANDGTPSRLLCARGTVPITYNGCKYNIPCAIFVGEAFPHVAPLAFVTPTRDMELKANHNCVHDDGCVDLAKIMTWDPSRSRLRDVARALTRAFSEEPPAFAKARVDGSEWTSRDSSRERRTHGNSTTRDSAHEYEGEMRGMDGRASPRTTEERHRAPFSVQTERRPSAEASTSARASENVNELERGKRMFRERAIAALTERFQRETERRRDGYLQSVELLLSQQTELYSRKIGLEHELAELRASREEYERDESEMRAATAMMQKWLDANGDDVAEFKAADPWSDRILKAHVKDKSIEDTLDALEDLLNDGLIHHGDYLRQVMKMCKEQFYARDEILTVTEMQSRRVAENAVARESAARAAHGNSPSSQLPKSSPILDPSFLQPARTLVGARADARQPPNTDFDFLPSI